MQDQDNLTTAVQAAEEAARDPRERRKMQNREAQRRMRMYFAP